MGHFGRWMAPVMALGMFFKKMNEKNGISE